VKNLGTKDTVNGGDASSHPGFAIIDFRWKKCKRTEPDDRKLPLCHAEVGGTKALVSRISKL